VLDLKKSDTGSTYFRDKHCLGLGKKVALKAENIVRGEGVKVKKKVTQDGRQLRTFSTSYKETIERKHAYSVRLGIGAARNFYKKYMEFCESLESPALATFRVFPETCGIL